MKGPWRAKLTTGREIASRRRLKLEKQKSQKVKKFSLFDFSGLFDFSFFWSL